ncbi:alanine racemase [Hominenteromicrobium sp.]|uniref:alanine racemase n=1 Tax=Hominenteromicrobium sp. TaxID=3073581 RepID=UPI00399B072D
MHWARCGAHDREYEALGADRLALSNIEKPCRCVRRASMPHAALGIYPGGNLRRALPKTLDIAQCAYSAEYCAALSENAVKSGVKVKIHVKVDTGMSRLGFYFQERLGATKRP